LKHGMRTAILTDSNSGAMLMERPLPLIQTLEPC
jgi:hypothetical protein